MSAESGRTPVLATLTAGQVPLLGPTPAFLGLKAGMENALYLAECHGQADITRFAAVLDTIRRGPKFDIDFSRAFAAGYTLAASEVRRIGGFL